MRKLFVAVLCMMSVSLVTAQKIKIKKSFLLSEQKGYYPKLSGDGSFVAFSSESYSGLSIYNFSTGAVQEVSGRREPVMTRFLARTMRGFIIEIFFTNQICARGTEEF